MYLDKITQAIVNDHQLMIEGLAIERVSREITFTILS